MFVSYLTQSKHRIEVMVMDTNMVMVMAMDMAMDMATMRKIKIKRVLNQLLKNYLNERVRKPNFNK